MSRAFDLLKNFDDASNSELTPEAFYDHFSDGRIWMRTSVLRNRHVMMQDNGVQYRDRSLTGYNGLVGIRAQPNSDMDVLKDSMSKEGIKNPIALYVDKRGKLEINDGTHRLLAAEELGMEWVPVQFVPNSVDNGMGYKFAIEHGAVLKSRLG